MNSGTDFPNAHHLPKVVWLIGLSGAGKSTIGDALIAKLRERGTQAARLDGDDLRVGLNSDLGFSPQDRAENLRRAAHVAHLFTKLGNVTICSFITPHESDRQLIRDILGEQYFEVYVSTSLQVCEFRDPKGLYKRARSGQIKEFTGISSAFEAAEDPDMVIDTEQVSVEDAVEMICNRICPDREA